MSDVLFLDASVWVAAVVARDPRHAEVERVIERLTARRARIITTNLVVAETHALVVRGRGAAAGLALLAAIAADPQYDVRFVDAELQRQAASRWLTRFRDQRFSLADAVSFEVMRRERLRTALALDHHFRIAGFQTLP